MVPGDQLPRVGVWLSCGGLVVLAAHHWLTMYEPQLSIDNALLLAGGLAGYLVTATGVFLSVGPRNRTASAPTNAGAPGGASPAGTEARRLDRREGWSDEGTASGDSVLHAMQVGRRMGESFLAWCEQGRAEADPWSSFDQLVREMLTEQVGAVRVRCFQVLPGDQQLRSLSRAGTSGDGKCARSGLLGHVATTGREFVAGDKAHGELVDQLAKDGEEPWDWVYPIREESQTVGLLAVGKLPPNAVLDDERRKQLSTLITVFWRFVSCLERLGIAEKTDKASGLLTRSDFFASATRALGDSYQENEPVVVAVLALEGLRGLDDLGWWRDHDALVENIGLLINRRIRTDDIIGRFSDDRFVLLLRRLIAAKIQATAQEEIEQLGSVGQTLRVRVGLTGSGFRKESLEKLLGSAFDAVERARNEDVGLYCDLPNPKPEPRSPQSEPEAQASAQSAQSEREAQASAEQESHEATERRSDGGADLARRDGVRYPVKSGSVDGAAQHADANGRRHGTQAEDANT
jgi:GGDEF domain-containing protein